MPVGTLMPDPRLVVALLCVLALGSLVVLIRRIRARGEYRPLEDVAIAAAEGRCSRSVTVAGWSIYALMLALLAGQVFLPVDPQDEGQWLTYPWLIAHGRMPYRDVWMTYPPATYLMLALLMKAGTPGIVAARGVGLLSRAVYPLLVGRVVTGSWRRFSWLAIPLTFCALFGASDIMAYPWILAMPLVFMGFAAVGTRPLSSAALFFVAGTFRFEFAAAGFAALAAYAALNALLRRPYRRAALAAALLLLSSLSFFALLNWVTAGYAFRDIFLDQLGPVQRGRFMALWPPTFGPIAVPLALVTFVGPPLAAAAALRVRRPDLAAAHLGVIVLMSHYYQRAERAHLYGVAAIALPWLLVSLLSLAGDGPDSTRPGRVGPAAGAEHLVARFARGAAAWVMVPIALWMALILAGYAAYVSPLSPLATNNVGTLGARIVSAGVRATIDRDAGEARDDRAVIAYLDAHALPGQSVFIGPRRLRIPNTRTDLYYLLPVPPASRYLEIQPGLEAQPAIQRQIIGRLRSCAWVLLLHGGQFYRFATGPYPVPHPLLDQYVAHHYRMVLRNPTYLLLRRRTAS